MDGMGLSLSEEYSIADVNLVESTTIFMSLKPTNTTVKLTADCELPVRREMIFGGSVEEER